MTGEQATSNCRASCSPCALALAAAIAPTMRERPFCMHCADVLTSHMGFGGGSNRAGSALFGRPHAHHRDGVRSSVVCKEMNTRRPKPSLGGIHRSFDFMQNERRSYHCPQFFMKPYLDPLRHPLTLVDTFPQPLNCPAGPLMPSAALGPCSATCTSPIYRRRRRHRPTQSASGASSRIRPSRPSPSPLSVRQSPPFQTP